MICESFIRTTHKLRVMYKNRISQGWLHSILKVLPLIWSHSHSQWETEKELPENQVWTNHCHHWNPSLLSNARDWFWFYSMLKLQLFVRIRPLAAKELKILISLDQVVTKSGGRARAFQEWLLLMLFGCLIGIRWLDWIGSPGDCFRSGGWTKFAQRFGNKRRLSRKGSAAPTSKLGLLSLVMWHPNLYYVVGLRLLLITTNIETL